MLDRMDKVYEETYKDYAISIYRSNQTATDGSSCSHYEVEIDGVLLAEKYDDRIYLPNIANQLFDWLGVNFQDASLQKEMAIHAGKEMSAEEIEQLLTADVERGYSSELIPPQESAALVAAKEYCDRELEILARRGNEILSLKLSSEEAESLLQVCRLAEEASQGSMQDLQKRLESLLKGKRDRSD